MGADLYIQSLYQPQYQRWEAEFRRAVRLRDRLTRGTEEHRQAQAVQLLAMLKARDNVFQLKLVPLPMNERKYFLDRYTDLQKFLMMPCSWMRRLTRGYKRQQQKRAEISLPSFFMFADGRERANCTQCQFARRKVRVFGHCSRQAGAGSHPPPAQAPEIM